MGPLSSEENLKEGSIRSVAKKIPWWVAPLSGILGSVAGVATNLYSAEFRSGIESVASGVNPIVASAGISAVVGSIATLLIYQRLARRESLVEVAEKDLRITSDYLKDFSGKDSSVVGRSIKYIEVERKTEDFIIFLHGLGLDANDFRPYMAESKFHCIALTLFGFNTSEKSDERYGPIGLEAHLQILHRVIKVMSKMHPNKRMTLVGFSFGADILMLLSRRLKEDGIEINKVVLLDPNINHSTMKISMTISRMESGDPLGQLKDVVHASDKISDFRNMCEYVRKITSKDLEHVRVHAKEMVDKWDPEGYRMFLDRLGQTILLSSECYVVFSSDYETHFNTVATSALERGMEVGNFECSHNGHFELIGPKALKERLEGVLA